MLRMKKYFTSLCTQLSKLIIVDEVRINDFVTDIIFTYSTNIHSYIKT